MYWEATIIPQTRITSDHYQDEYEKPFVEKWDELINWDKRAESENGFFRKLLQAHDCRRVLDVAAGTGFHSITLAQDGFQVTAVDGSADMLRKTQENAHEYKLQLPTELADWRWLTDSVSGKYDALLCLGNAFTHLFDEQDRQKALQQFYDILQPGGLAIIDQRNYDAILDNGYSSKHRYYYCGENVNVYPASVSQEAVKFRYAFEDGAVHHLTLYPIRQERLSQMLRETGFRQVWTYGDFQPEYKKYEPDFIIQVAVK